MNKKSPSRLLSRARGDTFRKRICLTDNLSICDIKRNVKGFLKNFQVMSLTFIIGENGAGKNSLMTFLLKRLYLNKGESIRRNSQALIKQANKDFGRNYTFPDQVPFYTINWSVKLHVGYRKYYEPYFLNGYYFGVANEKMDTQFIAPGSVLVFDEATRFFNSRESSSFSEAVSYAFQIHRHARLDIYFLAPRGMMLDVNIRELGVKVIEVIERNEDYDAAGNIIRLTWHCREFENWRMAKQYLEKNEETYTETEYVYEGNIHEEYDSHDKFKEFLPPEGKDFSYLPHDKPKNLSKREEEFYKSGKPKGYRENGNYEKDNVTA